MVRAGNSTTGEGVLVLTVLYRPYLQMNIGFQHTHRTARYPLTHISMNHLKGVASIFPPMIITISSVSLMSGSQPRLPPGELSNMKPKSGNTDDGKTTQNVSMIMLYEPTSHLFLFIPIKRKHFKRATDDSRLLPKNNLNASQ